MGKKRRNMRTASSDSGAGSGMPRAVQREVLALCNQLLEICSKLQKSTTPDFGEHAQIRDLVERLRKKQQGYTITHPNREEEFDNFLNWLKQNDVDVSAVEITKYDQAGYGLKATRQIKSAECFLKIPRSVMITSETAKKSVLATLKEDEILRNMPNVSLALHILCEKANRDSKWTPYLNILPSGYDTPLYFSVEELHMLQSSPTLVEILNQYKSIARQYAYFYKLFHGHSDSSKLPIKDFCYDDYRWAVSTVMTRQNQIPDSTGSDLVSALIPLWDMANHANGKLSTDFNLDTQSSVCYAFDDINEGDQVYIFYGARSNGELLMHSGFVYPANVWDRLPLKLGISKNDSLYALRAEALNRLGMSPTWTFNLHCGPVPVDSELIAFLRIFHMDMEELRERVTGPASKDLLMRTRRQEEVISNENEIKCWIFLQTRILLLLKTYGTDIYQDQDILLRTDLSQHARMIVELRHCEKIILHRTIEYAGLKLKYFKDRMTEEDEKEQEGADGKGESGDSSKDEGSVKDPILVNEGGSPAAGDVLKDPQTEDGSGGILTVESAGSTCTEVLDGSGGPVNMVNKDGARSNGTVDDVTVAVENANGTVDDVMVAVKNANGTVDDVTVSVENANGTVDDITIAVENASLSQATETGQAIQESVSSQACNQSTEPAACVPNNGGEKPRKQSSEEKLI